MLLVTSVFGGPVYSSVHGLDVCALRNGGLRCKAGSRDLRILRPAPPPFVFWRERKSVFRLHSESDVKLHVGAWELLPSFESLLKEGLLLDGLILDSTLRSAADDRSTTSITKRKWVRI